MSGSPPGQRAACALFLHGQPGGAGDWRGVVAALDSRLDAIAFDRPGWDGRRPPTDLRGNALAALEVLDQKGIERAMVVGHSLGAAVAVLMALERPERLAATVLASPAANVESLGRVDTVLAAPVVGSLLSAAALTGGAVALAAAPVRRRIASGLGLDEAYLMASSRGLLAPRAWSSFVSEQRMLVRELPGLTRRLADVTVPTTVVCGAADRVVSPGAARALAQQIPRAKLVVLGGAGHLLPQREPTRLAKVVLETAAAVHQLAGFAGD